LNRGPLTLAVSALPP